MADTLKKVASIEDYRIKQNRFLIPFSIVHSATPANKVVTNDLPDALSIATEGLTAATAAIDSGTNFTTPTDSTGIFGCLVYNMGTVKKLLYANVVTLSSGTAAVTFVGASSTGVTASSNIAVSVDSSLSFASTDLTGVLDLAFIVSKE